MSEKQFFNIGKHIINKNEIISILQRTEKVEVERNVVFITLKNKEEFLTVFLPEGKSLEDILTANDLN